jgi:hypothetical protein
MLVAAGGATSSIALLDRDALRSSLRATELARRALGPDDPYVASCVMDVGLSRYFLGDYD